MTSKTVRLDVRETIRNGGEPCGLILQTVNRLRPDEDLQLLAPFEPRPLFEMLGRQGFGHLAQPLENGDWEIRFSRSLPVTPPVQTDNPAPACGQACPEELDARGLEPPEPMTRILEAVTRLPQGGTLRARTDRRPMHLYPQLAARGLEAESTEEPDGSVLTVIRRPSDPAK